MLGLRSNGTVPQKLAPWYLLSATAFPAEYVKSYTYIEAISASDAAVARDPTHEKMNPYIKVGPAPSTRPVTFALLRVSENPRAELVECAHNNTASHVHIMAAVKPSIDQKPKFL